MCHRHRRQIGLRLAAGQQVVHLFRASDACGGRGHGAEIVSVDLDGNISANACDQFVEPQFDRLAELVKVADETAEGALHLRDQLVLGEDDGPASAPAKDLELSVLRDDVEMGR